MDITTRTAQQLAPDQPPLWELGHLDVAEKDGRKLLTDDQYAHAVQLFDQLAAEQNPRLSRTQDVRKIEDFCELRDKGGILGKINLRIYFPVIDGLTLILVLGSYKKEDEGQTPTRIKIRMRSRYRAARKLS